MKSNPVISVVFPAHNADAYIDESLQSILNQSFSNFEIIAIDDASTDRTFEILNKYRTSDDRIRIIQNKKNLGLAASLNFGIDLANAPFIARMDADDIAFPQRLQKQVNFLQKNPDIAGCGTSIEVFGASQGLQKKPQSYQAIQANLLWGNPIAHPTVMFRSSILKNIRYDESFQRAQDYELWSRMIFDHHLKLTNLPEILLKYRSTHSSYFIPWHIKVLNKNLSRMGINFSSTELDIHTLLSLSDFQKLRTSYTDDSIISWINKFIHHSSINLKGSNKETSNIIYGKLNTYWGRKCFVKKHKYINFPNRNAFFYIKLLLNKLRG